MLISHYRSRFHTVAQDVPSRYHRMCAVIVCYIISEIPDSNLTFSNNRSSSRSKDFPFSYRTSPFVNLCMTNNRLLEPSMTFLQPFFILQPPSKFYSRSTAAAVERFRLFYSRGCRKVSAILQPRL